MVMVTRFLAQMIRNVIATCVYGDGCLVGIHCDNPTPFAIRVRC